MSNNITDLNSRQEKFTSTPAAEEGFIAKDLEISSFRESFQDKVWNARERIRTGFTVLDVTLDGGLYPSLFTIGAISSMGKTTFVLNMGVNIARSGEAPVLYYSLEMSINEIIAKIASSFSYEVCKEKNIPKKYAYTTATISNFARFAEQTEKSAQIADEILYQRLFNSEYWKKPFYIKEGNSRTNINEIENTVYQIGSQTGEYPVLILDYLQILPSPDYIMTDKQKIEKAISELSDISKKFEIPVIVISSLNRSSYSGVVQESSYKESGLIEYHSDVLIGLQPTKALNAYKADDDTESKEKKSKLLKLNREEKAKTIREMSLSILKQRNGRVGGQIDLKYNTMYNIFEEVIGKENHFSKYDQIVFEELQKKGAAQ